jgi:hypothetical protein
MVGKKCKSCEIDLTPYNWIIQKTVVKNKTYEHVRKLCKSCRSQQVMNANKNNPKRKEYMNNRARKLGIVKQYPCETCAKLCYKKYAKAFCSVMCRFLSYVDKTTDCWVWLGGLNRSGYGKFSYNKKFPLLAAHRASYILFVVDIPTGLFICHSCDNTSCVNPNHLWAGSAKDNTQDCIKKGRFVGRKKG